MMEKKRQLKKFFRKAKVSKSFLFYLALTLLLITLPILYFISKPGEAEAGWWNDHWLYRKSIQISYTGSTAVTEYQVLVENVDTSTLVTAGKLQSDCADLRFTSATGKLLNYFIVGSTCNTTTTDIWVQVDSIPSTTDIAIYMYYGNPNSPAGQDELATFSYSSLKDVGYVLDSTPSAVGIMALGDGVNVTHQNGIGEDNATLRQFATTTFNVGTGRYLPFKSTGPISVQSASEDTDALVPISWAGTEFITYAGSTTTFTFVAIAPWQTASVDITHGGTACTGNTVTSAGASFTCAITSGYVRVTSDYPVIVFMELSSTNVPTPLIPSDEGPFLGSTNVTRVIADNASTNITQWSTASASSTAVNLGANGVSSRGGSNYGAAPGFKFFTTNSTDMGVIQINDGDGSDAHVYHHQKDMGTIYGGDNQIDYISVVSDQDFVCDFTDVNGSNDTTINGSSSNTEVFHGGYGTGDSNTLTTDEWYMTCDVPVAAHVQEATLSEVINWSPAMSRQYTYPAPSVGTVGTEQVSPGPIAHWTFDEGHSLVANSTVSEKYFLYVANAQWVQRGNCVSGLCVYQEGTDDGTLSSDVTMPIPSEYTLSQWIRGDSGSQIAEEIMTLGWEGRVALAIQSDEGDAYTGIRILDSEGSSFHDVFDGQDILDGDWHMLTATVNDSLEVNIYIDGELVHSDTIADHTAGSFYIQGSSWTGTNGNFTGFIDESKIYGYERTPDEIRRDYLAGLSGSDSSVAFGSSVVNNLSNGLVGYYRFEETVANSCDVSNDACDFSGYLRHGAWNGKAGSGLGRFGRGLSLDGTDDYAQINGLMGAPTAITLSAWVDLDAADTWGAEVISLGDNVILRADDTLTSGVTGSYDSGAGWDNVDSGIDIAGTGWRHLVYIVDPSTGRHELYIDGVIADSETISASIEYINNGSHTQVGRHGNAGTTYDFDGRIDDLRVYNRALTEAEVVALYKYEAEPYAYYDIEKFIGTQSDVTTLYDVSGNNYSASPMNSFGQPVVPGKYGFALDLDGSDNWVDLDNSNAKFIGEQGSVGMWASRTWTSSLTDKYLYERYVDANNYVRIYYANGSNTLAVLLRAGGTNSSISHAFANYPQNELIYISARWSKKDNVVEMLRNGVVVASTTFGGTWSGSLVGGSLGSTYTGASKWQGLVDDVKLYDFYISDTKVVQDMNAGHPVGGSPVSSAMNYWKFDEMYGDKATDSGSAGDDADLNGSCPGAGTCPTWTAEGYLNGALDYSGASNVGTYLIDSSTSAEVMNDDESFSYSLWFKSDANSGGDSLARIIDRNCNDYFCLAIEQSSGSGELTHSYSDTESYLYETDMGIDWHHSVGVWDQSTNDFRWYIDGELIYEDTSLTALNTSGVGIVLGGNESSGSIGTTNFNGQIDEVLFFSTALTQSEVSVLYNLGGTVTAGTTGTVSGTQTWARSSGYCPPGVSSCPAPVAEWLFYENTGTSAYDTSVNNNTASLQSTLTWVPGLDGRPAIFSDSDGSSSSYYMTVSDNNSLDFNNTSFTITHWFRLLDSLGSGSMLMIKNNLSLYAGDENTNYATFAQGDGTNCDIDMAGFFAGDGSSDQYVCSSGGLSDTDWHHLAVVVDVTANEVSIYIDGVLDTVDSFTLNPASTTHPIYFLKTDGAMFFDGELGPTRIYNEALNQSEVVWDYHRGKPIAQYTFDECQGSTVNSSGTSELTSAYANDIDLTLTIGGSGGQTSAGTCSGGSSSQAWSNGSSQYRDNSSVSLDGTDDYLTTDDDKLVTFTDGSADQPFSISSWVYSDADSTYTIFAKRDEYKLYVSSNTLYGELTDSTGYIRQSASSIPSSQWNHFVMTYDGEGEAGINLYLNGKELSTSGSTSGTYTAMTNTAYALEFGRENTGGGPVNYLDGYIDESAIFRYELTPEQVELLYNDHAALRFR